MIPEWIDSALAAGLAADVLELHLQPIVYVDDGTLYGAESFARWRDPEHGLIPASAWIPHAETTGAIVGIARSILPTWLGSSKGSDGPIVSFNLGGRQLLDDSGIDELVAVPRDVASGLALEIPHLQFFPEAANAAASVWSWNEIDDLDDRLARLSAAGFSIWLDDFGDVVFDEGPFTHPSIDLIKLDRSLLDIDPGRLEGIVKRVHDAGKTSLLEGIETAAHREKAMAAGIELAQGFLYAPPLPSERFEQFGQGSAG